MGASNSSRQQALNVLGLTGTPTAAEITAAYRRRARDTHPDTAGATDTVAQRSRFTAVVEAYRLLSSQPRATARSRDEPHLRAANARRAAQQRPPIVAGPVIFTPTVAEGRHHG